MTWLVALPVLAIAGIVYVLQREHAPEPYDHPWTGRGDCGECICETSLRSPVQQCRCAWFAELRE